MLREQNIPLFLWIATAVLVHLLGGGGADQAARVLEDRLDVRRFADSVRRHVRQSTKPIEVALLASEETTDERPPSPTEAAEDATPEESEATLPDDRESEPKDDPDPVDPKPEEKLEPPEARKPEQQKPPEEEKKPEKKEEEAEKPDVPTLQLKNRIAVVQHVDDENQEDNPNAEFIGDHANRVEEQTQARITATDQNDPAPNPGTAHSGPPNQPGNSHVNDIAHSEDAPGEMDRAPNEQSGGGKKAESSYAEAKGGGSPSAKDSQLEAREGRADGRADGDSRSQGAARAEQQAALPTEAREATPDTLRAPGGRFSMNDEQSNDEARRGREAEKKRLPPRKGSGPMDFLGLGREGTTRGGINLNLSPSDAVAAVGRDQLARERLADGERRRSKHRGSWKALGIEKWRAAIENYNSSVKPGNQTALNTARVPFASYLNQIHNRLHPIFADSFLASLGGLPKEHPLSKPDMKTNLEIVIDKDEGKVVKMGVTRSSGSTIFDIAALESVQSASPFGKPPKSIVSPDGNVYLHWEFHRNPFYACSTYFARPFILNVQQEEAPPKVSPPVSPPFGPGERPLPREGRLMPFDTRPRVGADRVHATR